MNSLGFTELIFNELLMLLSRCLSLIFQDMMQFIANMTNVVKWAMFCSQIYSLLRIVTVYLLTQTETKNFPVVAY